MKPPKGWEVHDDDWFIRQVEVLPDRWLLLFLKHSDKDYLPAGWINIYNREWLPELAPHKIHCIREFALKEGSLLELSCIEHEWTQEILDGKVGDIPIVENDDPA